MTRIVIPDPNLRWAGAWSPEQTYPPKSIVRYEERAYITRVQTQGDIPTLGEPWELFVEGGPGPTGPEGPPGPPGPPGPAKGGNRWYGEGPPGVVIGAEPGDEYLDILTGDLYVLT